MLHRVYPPYLVFCDLFHFWDCVFMKTEEYRPSTHLICSNFWVRLLNAQLSALFCPHL